MKKSGLILVLILCAVSLNAQNQTASKLNANKVRVKVNELPREITTFDLGTHHIGYAIKEAYKITQGGIKNYEVHISNGTTNETLLYDNNGKFIKKTESVPVIFPKKEPVNSKQTTLSSSSPKK